MKNELVKKPHQEEEFTNEQLLELHKCAHDPIYFMKTYMKVMHPKRGAIPFILYDYQEEAVMSFLEKKDVILMMGRQQGKTTVIAAFLLWYACFNGGAQELLASESDDNGKYILVASKDNDAAMDVLSRIKFSYEELPMWIKPGCVLFNRHEISFDNGSTIKSQATTENTGRGRSVSLLMIDELAFVKSEIQGAMWTSLAPTLSTGGKCIISSTPNGDKELFSQLWREAKAGGAGSFHPIFAPWYRHPDRGPEYEIEMRRKVGDLMFDQEYACEFVSSDPLLIDSRHAREMERATYAPDEVDEKGVKWWGKRNRSRYMVGGDVSEGLGKDYSTLQIFCADTLEQVGEFRDQHTDEAGLFEVMKHVFNKLLKHKDPRTGRPPEVMWSYENNAQGKVISTLYDRDSDFPDVELISVGEKRGMQTNVATKAEASKLFKKMIEQQGGYKVKSKELVEEIKNYVRATNQGTYKAKTGSTDDLISSTLIITRIYKFLANHDDEAFDRLYRGAPAGETDNSHQGDIEPMPFGFL
jgi:hypothetical protein